MLSGQNKHTVRPLGPSYTRNPRIPRLPNPLQLFSESLTRNLRRPPLLIRQPQRRPLLRLIKPIQQQLYIRRLHRPKCRPQLSISEPRHRLNLPTINRLNRASSHIHYNNEFTAGVSEPAVRSEAFVQGVQEAEVLGEGVGTGADVEDVEAGVEDEGHV